MDNPELLFDAYDHLANNFTLSETDTTTYFSKLLLSAIFVSDKCYLKCVDDPEKVGKDRNCEPKWWNKESRYCPEDDLSVTCQVECITTQRAGNHLKGVPGADRLPEHAVFMQAVAEASSKAFKEHGNNYTSPVKMLEAGVLSFDKKIRSEHAPFTLPVSISPFNKLTEFESGPDAGNKLRPQKTMNQQFPCVSGDWTSDKTQEFLTRLEFNRNGRDVTSGMMRELLEEICVFQFQAMHPATHFLALCADGLQFPRWGNVSEHDMQYKTKRGPHKNCEPFRAELKAKKMSEMEGNLYFCSGNSTLAEEVMTGEKTNTAIPAEDPPPTGMSGANYRGRCDYFLSKHKKEYKKYQQSLKTNITLG